MARSKIEPKMLEFNRPLDPFPEGAQRGTRPIAVRLPLEIERMLLGLDSPERVRIMRRGVIVSALENWPEDQPLPVWANEFLAIQSSCMA